MVPLVYLSMPILTGSGELPTPTTLNGVQDKDLPSSVFYPLYFLYTTNSIIIFFYVMADDIFFILNILMFYKRFETIKDILGLLNYGGERNRQKDKRILRDTYRMHIELKE